MSWLLPNVIRCSRPCPQILILPGQNEMTQPIPRESRLGLARPHGDVIMGFGSFGSFIGNRYVCAVGKVRKTYGIPVSELGRTIHRAVLTCVDSRNIYLAKERGLECWVCVESHTPRTDGMSFKTRDSDGFG